MRKELVGLSFLFPFLFDRPANSFLLFSVKKMFVWKRELKIGSSGANDQLTFRFQTNLLVTASLSLS